MDDPGVLVCVRVADLRRPSVVSIGDHCARCHAPVWRSARSAGMPFEILCTLCFVRELDAEPEPVEITVAPYVAEDLRDRRRRRSLS